ncbi:hypothetical protein TNCV_2947051 [Trichonephila clavipes]|nr:hypothetical protein TNCV_2947051 [Trichonephila clavipes]
MNDTGREVTGGKSPSSRINKKKRREEKDGMFSQIPSRRHYSVEEVTREKVFFEIQNTPGHASGKEMVLCPQRTIKETSAQWEVKAAHVLRQRKALDTRKIFIP